MKRLLLFLAAFISVAGSVTVSRAETTLEKISQTGIFTIGTRTGSPPFAYVNKNNEWVGFSIDLVETSILPLISKSSTSKSSLKKESAPNTRIPLLTSNAVDLIAETMTDTQSRREQVDFSLTFSPPARSFSSREAPPLRDFRPSLANGSQLNRVPPMRKLFASACRRQSCWNFRINLQHSKPWPRDKCKLIRTMEFNSPV